MNVQMITPKYNTNPAFKAHVKVEHYAKSDDGIYRRVTDTNQIRKCQNIVVRNLNGSIKNREYDIVNKYKAYDYDYNDFNFVRSAFIKDKNNKDCVYLISGQDAKIVENMAKEIGIAKGSNSSVYNKRKEVAQATSDYFENLQDFLQYNSRRIKVEKGPNLVFKVLFNPKYKKNGDINFKYADCCFAPEKR